MLGESKGRNRKGQSKGQTGRSPTRCQRRISLECFRTHQRQRHNKFAVLYDETGKKEESAQGLERQHQLGGHGGCARNPTTASSLKAKRLRRFTTSTGKCWKPENGSTWISAGQLMRWFRQGFVIIGFGALSGLLVPAATRSLAVRSITRAPERFNRKVVRLIGRVRVDDRHGWDLVDFREPLTTNTRGTSAVPGCIHLIQPDKVLASEYNLRDTDVRSIEEAAQRVRMLANRSEGQPVVTVRGRYRVYDEAEYLHLSAKEQRESLRAFASKGECFGELLVYELIPRH